MISKIYFYNLPYIYIYNLPYSLNRFRKKCFSLQTNKFVECLYKEMLLGGKTDTKRNLGHWTLKYV